MDISRAKEILNSEKTIEVKLGGVPVWIDKVDAPTSTATVHLKNNPSSQKTVSVDQLQEV